MATGTGKTVIAINLLAQLTKQGQFVQYTSKNSAPRNVYLAKLKGLFRKSSVDNMFKGSGIYTDSPTNAVHTILADESHRLNEKSGMFHNKGENQIKEIINASYCSVFFIDECQRVTIQDIGSIEEIKKWASQLNSQIEYVQLKSQFRCNGSDGYLAWVDDVLQIRETANSDGFDLDYDIQEDILYESVTTEQGQVVNYEQETIIQDINYTESITREVSAFSEEAELSRKRRIKKNERKRRKSSFLRKNNETKKSMNLHTLFYFYYKY